MDINSLFLSKKNIEILSRKLAQSLKLSTDSKSFPRCKDFMENQMKNILKKYGNKKPKTLSIPEFVEKLSEKSLEESIKLYLQKKKQYSSQDLGKYQMNRDSEINNGQQKGLMKRPQHTSGMKNNSEFPGVMDSMQGSGSNYAPLSAVVGNGMFTRADGTMGTAEDWQKPMSENPMYSSGKANSDELQRRVLMREQEYDRRPMGANMEHMSNMGGMGMNGMNGMGMNGMGMNGMNGMGMNGMNGMGMNGTSDMNGMNGMNGMGGMDNMGMGLMYNPNPYGKQKPPEINFAVDGTDTRGSARRQREEQQKLQEIMTSMPNNQGMMGIGFDMNNMDFMGMMDPNMNMGMNMGDFNSIMETSMVNNPMMNNAMMNNTMMNNPIMNNPIMNSSMMNNPMMNNLMMNNAMMSNSMMNNAMMGNSVMNNSMTNSSFNNNSNSNSNNNNIKQNNLSENKMSDMDFKTRMNQIQQDRNQINNSVNFKQKNFNPTISPNANPKQYQQMLNMNQGFIKGRGVGIPDFKNMKSEELQKYIEKKKDIMQNYTVDLKQLKNMSSDKIKELRDKLIKEINIETEELQTSISRSRSDEEEIIKHQNKSKSVDTEIKSEKSELLNLIMQLKKGNKKTEEELQEFMEKSLDNIKPVIEKKSRKKNIKIDEESLSSDNDTLINSDDNNNYNDTKIIKIVSDPKENQLPEYFSDYMLTLNEVIKSDIVSIEVSDLEFLKTNNLIDENNNQFIFIENNEEREVELENGDYTIREIIELMQSCFEQHEINFSIHLNKKNNKIIIENINKESFEMRNEKNSVLKLLGFTDEYYEGNYKYESNLSHTFFDVAYMYIYYGVATTYESNQINMFGTEPFATINFNKIKKVYQKKITERIDTPIDCLFIKFKNVETEENESNILFNFMHNPHKFNMKIKIKEIKNKNNNNNNMKKIPVVI